MYKRVTSIIVLLNLCSSYCQSLSWPLRPKATIKNDGIVRSFEEVVDRSTTLLHQISQFIYKDEKTGKTVLRLFADFEETITLPYKEQRVSLMETIATSIGDPKKKEKFLEASRRMRQQILAEESEESYRIFYGAAAGIGTLTHLKEFSKTYEFNENFIAILKKIKERTGVDRIEITIVGSGIAQLFQMFFQRSDIQKKMSELSIGVAHIIANSFVFDERGVFTGQIKEDPLILNKDKYISKDALFLGDERDARYGIAHFIDVNKGVEASDKILESWILVQLKTPPIFADFSDTIAMPLPVGSSFTPHEDTIREIVAADLFGGQRADFMAEAIAALQALSNLPYGQKKQKDAQERWLRPFAGKLHQRHFNKLVEGWGLNPNFPEAVRLVKRKQNLFEKDPIKISIVTGTMRQVVETFIATNEDMQKLIQQENVVFNIAGISLIMDKHGYYTGHVKEIDDKIIYGATRYPEVCIVIGDSFMKSLDVKGAGFGERLVVVNGEHYDAQEASHIIDTILISREGLLSSTPENISSNKISEVILGSA